MRDLTETEKQALQTAADARHEAWNEAHRWSDALKRDAQGSNLSGFLSLTLDGINAERYKRCERASRACDRKIAGVMRGIL